ncbi:alpha/beta fold hydrolase [uncultured Sphingomonas sp.]|uniref:alpha/beta hydrolase n=1 Tax=uncultured Sphingomonas sp. TaxID=158754 RepID=UPI0034588590
MRTSRSRLMLGAVALAASGATACWIIGGAWIKPRSSVIEAAQKPNSDFYLQSDKDIRLRATFYPGRSNHSPGVMILHGLGESRQASAANASWLASLGYAVLTLDLRGHGQSTMTDRSFGLTEAHDAYAGLTWLKGRQNNARVGVIGISLGGAAAVLGDRGPVDADALVLQAVYPDIRRAIRNRLLTHLPSPLAYALEPALSAQSFLRFGEPPSRLSPLARLPLFKGPVLIIGGAKDRYTTVEDTRDLFRAVSGKKQLLLVGHGDHEYICHLQSQIYRRSVSAFFEKSLGRT